MDGSVIVRQDILDQQLHFNNMDGYNDTADDTLHDVFHQNFWQKVLGC